MKKIVFQLTLALWLIAGCTKDKDQSELIITINDKEGLEVLPADGETYAKVTCKISNGLQESNQIKFTTTNGSLFSTDLTSSVEAKNVLIVKAKNGEANCYLKTMQLLDSNVFISCNLNGLIETKKIKFVRVYPDTFYTEVSNVNPEANEQIEVNVYFQSKENRYFTSNIPVLFQVVNDSLPDLKFYYPAYANSVKIDGKEKASIGIKNLNGILGKTHINISCDFGTRRLSDSIVVTYK